MSRKKYGFLPLSRNLPIQHPGVKGPGKVVGICSGLFHKELEVQQGVKVEEDEEDVQHQTRVSVVLVPQSLMSGMDLMEKT